jgi:hypothetical protein
MTEMIDRLGLAVADIETYVREMVAWRMQNGSVKHNSWGIEIQILDISDREAQPEYIVLGSTLPGAGHNDEWYMDNANGKNRVGIATGLDSHVALSLYPGLLAEVDGVFPWGGAVADKPYGLYLAFSGGRPDEDLLVVRDVHNWLVMHADRVGRSRIQAALDRGHQDGRPGHSRFTAS